MIVLMGANGHITSKAAPLLLAQRKKIRVVGRNASRLQALRSAGAELAVGDAGDAAFLASAFRGADAVYAMIPPNYGAPDMRAFQRRVGAAIAEALASTGVRRVVNMSSFGGGLPSGTGPIVGLHEQEERLDALEGVSLLHLRPSYFFENHFGAVPIIRRMGVYAGMIKPDVPFAQIATRDVAAVVATELAASSTTGVRHLLGPRDLTMAECARILGAAIGKPALPYVEAPPAAAKAGMVQAGFSPNVADLLEEMSRALSNGTIQRTATRDPQGTTPTTLEAFAPEFAAAFKAS